jgi:large subunit ribosomal protein L18
MKQGPRFNVKPRRRREGYTDYRTRLALLKSGMIRIVIRNSLRNIRVQFIDYHERGDKIIASAISKELIDKFNWKFSSSSTPAAYLTGLLAGKRALEHGIKEGVLDIGRQVPVINSRNFSVLKGVLDAGINCPHDKSKLPNEDRILGKHINNEISSVVNDLKAKITGGKQ